MEAQKGSMAASAGLREIEVLCAMHVSGRDARADGSFYGSFLRRAAMRNVAACGGVWRRVLRGVHERAVCCLGCWDVARKTCQIGPIWAIYRSDSDLSHI